MTSCDDCAGGGTSVGSGSSLIEKVGASCAACGATVDDVTGAVFAPIKAHPPIVAATEAALINIFTPDVVVVGRLVGFTGGMSLTPIVASSLRELIVAPVFAFTFVLVLTATG